MDGLDHGDLPAIPTVGMNVAQANQSGPLRGGEEKLYRLGNVLPAFLDLFVRKCEKRSQIILPFTTYDLVADFYTGDHAGIGETSLMMALRSDLVRFADRLANEPLPGVIGDPRTQADAELGLRIFNESAARCYPWYRPSGGVLDREIWIETLEIVVDILEITRGCGSNRLANKCHPSPPPAIYTGGRRSHTEKSRRPSRAFGRNARPSGLSSVGRLALPSPC